MQDSRRALLFEFTNSYFRGCPLGFTQKAKLVKGVTQLRVDIMGKSPQTVMVLVEEIGTDNRGLGGETVTAGKRKAPRGGKCHE